MGTINMVGISVTAMPPPKPPKPSLAALAQAEKARPQQGPGRIPAAGDPVWMPVGPAGVTR